LSGYEYEYDDISEWNADDCEELNAFIEYLLMLQENDKEDKMRFINPIRLNELKYSLIQITRIIKRTSPNAKIEYDLNDGLDTGHAAIIIETDEISVKETKRLIESIKFASDIDIFPLKSGNMRIILGFKNMLLEINP